VTPQAAVHHGSAGPEPMKSAILRIYAAKPAANGERESVGVGFLVSHEFALTSAHVVYAALALAAGTQPPEGAVVTVDLPLLSAPAGDGGVLTVSIEELIPRQPTGAGDVAVLRLNAPVPDARPVRLVMADDRWDHRAGVFGLSAGHPAGVWHSGLLKGPQANGWIQMNLDPASGGHVVSPGFSGGPVWDEALGGVAGMVVAAEAGAPPVSYLIPTERLAAAWPKLRELTLPPSPFRSLKPFEESDQAIFHGRQEDAERIAQAVGRRGWTTLIGPTGSGKSSLARAGVVPLRRMAGEIPVVIRPARGSSPLRALAAGLVPLLEPDISEMDRLNRADDLASRLTRDGLRDIVPVILARHRTARLLVVIDQFEELLDLDQEVIDPLVALLSDDRPLADVRVLATLRADFVETVLNHQILGPLVSQTFEGLMPMNRDQLGQAITAPVQTVPGVRFEPGLAEQILEDTGTDPGALPLLGFTLDLLWSTQASGMLTFQAYHTLGGVAGALAAYAERAWADVPDAGKPAARRLLPRLVRVPIGSEAPTRRVVPRAELGDDEWRVAQLLAAARLLVINTRINVNRADVPGFDAESVELAHEVLITAWPELAQQVTADNAFLTWRESVRHDTDRWEKAARDKELLPAKPALDAADLWLPKRARELSESERDFLQLGHARHRSRTRRRRAVIAMVCALALAVVSVGAVSVRLNNDTARAAAIARANNLAAAAAALEPSDPGLAGQLAVAAYRTSPTQAAVTQLYATLTTPLDRMVENTGDAILQAATQADGPLAAVMDDNGSLRIWNTANPAAPALDTTIHTHASAIALAPRSALVAAACPAAKALCLWSLAAPRRPVVISQLPTNFGAIPRTVVDSMAISSDGTMLAAADENGQTFLWSIAQPAHPRPVTHLANPGRGTLDDLSAVAFAPRGHLLATTIQDGETEIWNLAHPATPSRVATIGTGYQAVTFSPDGTLLAAAGDTTTGLWRLHDPAHPASININDSCSPMTGGTLDFSTAAFSPDGGPLVFSGTDTLDGKGELCSLSLDSSNLNADLPDVTGTLTGFGTRSMAYTASGALLTGGHDGIVRLWHWPLPEADGATPADDSTWALSTDGDIMAAPIGLTQYRTQLGIWDLTAPGAPALDSHLRLPALLQSVQFLSETALLTVAHNGAVQLWNVRNPRHPIQAATLGMANFTVPGPGDIITSTGVTADAAGTLVTVQGSDNLLHLWHINGALHASEIASIRVPNITADFAGTLADGRTAFILTSKGIDWWNITNPAHPKRGGTSALNGANRGIAVSAGNLFAGTATELGTLGDLTLDLYDITDGKLHSTTELPGPVGSTLNISNDGHLLAVTGAAGNTITLWDTSDPKHPRTLAAVPTGQEVNDITFDPSDRLMADWNGASGLVQVWDIANPAAPVLEYTLATPDGSNVASAAFTQSGAMLAVAGDTSIALFNTDPAETADRLCSYTGGTITTAQWTQFAPGIPYQNPCPPALP
jgi:WD40 repeat protein